MPRIFNKSVLSSMLLIGSLVLVQTSNAYSLQDDRFESTGTSEPEVTTSSLEPSAHSEAGGGYVVIGTAYDLDNNQLIYRESYTAIDSEKSVRVDYSAPDGKIFSSKKLTYKGEPFQPSFVLQDKRDYETFSAQFEGPVLVLSRADKDYKEQKKIYDNAGMVIDAGFDAYIQLHWDKLSSGDRMKFDFAMPNRLSSVMLEVRKINSIESPVYNESEGKNWIYFRLVPAATFISLFADPIYLAYNPNGKYLKRFQGRSNLDDNKGGPWDVRIEYEYVN